jgi:hypothetical protein
MKRADGRRCAGDDTADFICECKCMNNPYLLTGVGILLTVAAVGIYLRWRRSPRGRASVSMFSAWVRDRRKPEVASVRLPDGAGFLTGTARRPIGEVRLMFGVWILIGIFLTIVSLAFRDAIQDFTAEWVPFPFLILGLAAAVGGAFFGERLDRPGRAERIAAFLSYRLGMDLVRFTCFLGGAVFFLQAAAAAVFWSGRRAVHHPDLVGRGYPPVGGRGRTAAPGPPLFPERSGGLSDRGERSDGGGNPARLSGCPAGGGAAGRGSRPPAQADGGAEEKSQTPPAMNHRCEPRNPAAARAQVHPLNTSHVEIRS